MPTINFANQTHDGSSPLNLTRADYQENESIAGEVGIVYWGKGEDASGSTMDVAVKLPLNRSRTARIKDEYKVLSTLADATHKASGRIYTPVVQLGYETITQLPALVMPRYQQQVAVLVRDKIKAGDLLDAEKLAVEYAIQFTYILEALHIMQLDDQQGFTSTDRKLGDLFIHDGNLVVIDWNILKTDTLQNREVEIEFAFGQVWYELFLGRRSVGTPPMLDDDQWQPIGNDPIPGGMPGLGLRAILTEALESHRSRFDGDPVALRQALQMLLNILNDPALLEEQQLGSYVHLTARELAALQADLKWRQTSDSREMIDIFEIRQTRMEAARQQVTTEAVAEAVESIQKGSYRAIMNALQDHIQRDTEHSLDTERLHRWLLLTEALQDPNDRTVDYLYEQRTRLVEIVQNLDAGRWIVDNKSKLHDLKNQLASILERLSLDSQAYEKLNTIASEINLRLALITYQADRFAGIPAAKRLEQLQHISTLADVHPYLKHFLDDVLQLASEKASLQQVQQVTTLIDETRDSVYRRFQDLSYPDRLYLLEIRQSIAAAKSRLIESSASADDYQRLVNELEAAERLIDFGLLVTQVEGGLSLNWQVEEAVTLSRQLKRYNLQHTPGDWLKPRAQRAIDSLYRARDERSLAAVASVEAQHAATAVKQNPNYFANMLGIEPDSPGNILDELLADYRKMQVFFSDFFQTIIQNQYLDKNNNFQLRVQLDAPDWQKLMIQAKEYKINMSEIFAEEYLDQWRELLNLQEVEHAVRRFQDELKGKLENGFFALLDNIEVAMEESFDLAKRQDEGIRQMVDDSVQESSLVQISYEIKAGMTHGMAFDRERAAQALREAQNRLQNDDLLVSSGTTTDRLRQSIPVLRQIVQDLESIAARSPQDLQDLQLINRTVEQGQRPDQTFATQHIDIHELFSRYELLTPVRMLREKVWMLRLSDPPNVSQQDIYHQTVTVTVDAARQSLQDIRQHFYQDKVDQAVRGIKQVRQQMTSISGNRLSDVLLEELLESWENRIRSYNFFQNQLKLVSSYLDDEEQVVQTSKRPQKEINVPRLHDLSRRLIDLMRMTDSSVFTTGLEKEWKDNIQRLQALYSTAKIDVDLMPFLQEIQLKMPQLDQRSGVLGRLHTSFSNVRE